MPSIGANLGADYGHCITPDRNRVNEIVSEASETVRQLADLLGDGGVTIVVQKTPARLLHRLAYLESTREVRKRIRQSGLPPMSRLLGYEQINIAEDAGGYIAEYKAGEIAEATGMSKRTTQRHHQNLVDAKVIRTHAYGQGAGSRKTVEILVPVLPSPQK